jgi:type IV pilus assembly protein PilY1
VRRVFIRCLAAVAALCALGGMPAAADVGMAPDVRSVPPVVLLLVDTSGSMERKPDCACVGACEECLPRCGTGADDERNRWSMVLEALTGSFDTFTCERRDRTGGEFAGQLDHAYAIPYHRPPLGSPQQSDGVLDVYVDRVKFGLMTFDGVSTFLDARTDLVTEVYFRTRLGDNVSQPGDYSYGEPKAFTFPGCEEPFMLDNGARNEAFDAMGRMISVGGDLSSDREAVNQAIQQALMEVRPYGATPIAGMLDDLRYYLNNHPDVKPVGTGGGGDPYAACRSRNAILVTSGLPNADMRGHPVYCDTDGYECPYDLPATIAADLCRYSGGRTGCSGKLDGLFVVALDVANGPALQQLHDLADAGGTERAIVVSELLADGRASTEVGALVAALAEALDQSAPSSHTRAVPAFATQAVSSTLQTQSQVSAGFRIGSPGEPWEGVLERTRFLCGEDLTPQRAPLGPEDRFHEVLNRRASPRRLFTVVPQNLANLGGHLAGEDTGLLPISTGGAGDGGGRRGAGGRPSECGGNPPGPPDSPPGQATGGASERGLSLTPFQTGNGLLRPEVFGVPSQNEADEIIRWVHGDPGSGREDRRLGAIYHSSPVIVGPPQQDLPDESFNLFRMIDEVATRPTVMYVGSNDGILHAFVVEDTAVNVPGVGTRTYKAGEELWGFVPPMLLPKLKAARTSHQWMVDGTPVVKDIFYERAPGADPDAAIYHTVLVVGMRGGGNGYVALDVTNPLDPKFIFQFAHPQMGLTYGRPALGQVLVNTSQGLRERAFVFLPGGKGNDLTEDLCRTTGPIGCPGRGKGMPPANEGTANARSRQRCWDTTGRHMFFVDPATGDLVRHLNDRVFNAPLSGGASLFQGQTGTTASRAFITDADGVLWRFDISSRNVAEWDAEPFYDLFADAAPLDGQPAYHPPVLSTDPEGRVVILQGTGDIDRLDGLATNRVVSVTEVLEFDSAGRPVSARPELNWTIRLPAGEQVTGPIDLFFGDAFFATFRSSTSTTDACEFGSSYIWGVHYTDNPEGAAEDPLPRLPTEDPEVRDLKVGPFPNELINGVAINQQPTCVGLEVSETDPFLGSRAGPLGGVGGGGFELVALVSGGGRAGASQFGELRMDLAMPMSLTQVASFAGSVD